MAGNQNEFEIKLTGTAQMVAALPDSAIVHALTQGAGSWRHLKTTYYDTDNEDLRRKGISLRVRSIGLQNRQTVKRKLPAGSLEREELECALGWEDAFPAQTGDGEVDHLLSSLSERLEPLARYEVDRWSAAFSFRNSKLELAVDLGAAVIHPEGEDPSPKLPLAEAELELLDGDPEDLFSAAKLLLANSGLRFAGGTKLDATLARARGLQYAVPPRARLSHRPEDTAGDLLTRSLALIADRLVLLQPIILEARAPEGVHQVRVELRRLRAIERLYRKNHESGRLRLLGDRARKFATLLGAARDWDVFTGETLTPAASYEYAPEGITALKAEAMSRRAGAWAKAVAVIGGEEFTAFLLDLYRTAYAPPWKDGANQRLDQPATAFAAKALDRSMRKTIKAAATIELNDPATRHPLRVALKKLRYGVQLFRGLYPKEERKPYMAAMSALQDAFGAVNDAVVAQRLANEAAGGGGEEMMRAAGFITGLYAAKAEAAADQIDEAWKAFETMAPFWRA